MLFLKYIKKKKKKTLTYLFSPIIWLKALEMKSSKDKKSRIKINFQQPLRRRILWEAYRWVEDDRFQNPKAIYGHITLVASRN
jgi:hypothetical protein